MPRRKLPPITDAQWQASVDAYELGNTSCRKIADNLGVSPATVCRKMKRHGAVKASRLDEVMAPVRAAIDRQVRERIAAEAVAWDAAYARSVELTAIMDQMMAAIFDSDRAGNVTLAAGVITKTKVAFALLRS